MTTDELRALRQHYPQPWTQLVIRDDFAEKFYALLALYHDTDLIEWSRIPFEVKEYLREAMSESFDGAGWIAQRCAVPVPPAAAVSSPTACGSSPSVPNGGELGTSKICGRITPEAPYGEPMPRTEEELTAIVHHVELRD